jgi:Tfp pilus assembly protein PilZ
LASVYRERRTFDRCAIEDGHVRYVEAFNLGLFKKYSSELPLKDISQSGIRIEVNKFRKPGDEIDMLIDIPGYPSIQIRGHVRWIQEFENPKKIEIGILFLPFGSSKEYNSFRCKSRLDNTIKRLLH